MDIFITALFALAENCEYGELHDNLLRDKLVVGIRDASLSERMQLDSIAKAITMVRQSEEIKQQQTDLRDLSANKAEMDAMHFKRGK